MRFYSDIAYLVCISTVILVYMDFSVCVSVGDPNCGEILVCGFTGHVRADLHFLRVFSGDTIGFAQLLLTPYAYLRRISIHGKLCMHFCGGSQLWQNHSMRFYV